MQISLTIASDNPDDLARVLAALGAGGASFSMPGALSAPQVQTIASAPADGDDDDGAPADPNAPAVDSSGLPWDERIHSSSRKVGADGTWNKRRGGPKGAELAAIEAELRARSAPPMPTALPQPAPVPAYTPPMPEPVAQPMSTPVPAYVPPVAQPQPVPVPQPMPVPAPVAAAVEAPTPTAQPTDFHSFIQEVSTRTGRPGPDGAPLIHAEYLAQLSARVAQATGFAMNSVMDLAQRPDLIPYTIQVMQADGRW